MRFWRTPLDANDITLPHGEISILVARCKGCEICKTYCPRDVLAMSSTFNPKGYYFPQVVKPEACVACGLCQIMCPEFAIYVTETANV